MGDLKEPGVKWFEENGEVFMGGLRETGRTDEDELGLLLEVWQVAKDIKSCLSA